jgi:hypothetical protein
MFLLITAQLGHLSDKAKCSQNGVKIAENQEL